MMMMPSLIAHVASHLHLHAEQAWTLLAAAAVAAFTLRLLSRRRG